MVDGGLCKFGSMALFDQKAILKSYLQDGREALLWKLEHLRDYDVRRPLVPSWPNLLGLVKHVAAMDGSCFGFVFGRPFPDGFPSLEPDVHPYADMWATPVEGSAKLSDL